VEYYSGQALKEARLDEGPGDMKDVDNIPDKIVS